MRPIAEMLETRRLLANVGVSINDLEQTIVGIGGNFARGRFDGLNVVQDNVGNYMLQNLPPKHARIGVPLPGFEPVNDNGNPNTFDWNDFVDVGNAKMHNVFLMLRDFAQRGIPTTASVWDAPNWMVTNPQNITQRKIAPAMYGEFIESMAAFMIKAKNDYGMEFDYISLNESNGGINLLFTGQEMANLIKQSGPIFAGHGLKTKWLVGDVSNAIDALPFITPILQDPGTAAYTGPISFHSWDSTSPDSVLTGIADIAAQYGKEVWCEELGYDPYLWQNPVTQWGTWEFASKTNKIFSRVMRLSKTTVVDYWQYQEDYEPINKQSLVPYPVYYLIEQMAKNLTPGTTVVKVSTDDTDLLPLAAKNQGDNRFFAQVQNLSGSSKSVTLTGLPNQPLKLVRSSINENNATIGTYTPVNGTLTLTLKGDSVNTLTGTLDPAPTTGTISGKIFNDFNSNSVRDETDQGLSGWTVYLDANNNNVKDGGEISVTTNASGDFTFADVLPGTHVVRQVVQNGWRRSLPAPPTNSFSVTLAAGQNLAGFEFGNTTNILITGTVYFDNNTNGIQELGDGGLQGMRVFVDLDNNGSYDDGEPNRITDTNGFFQFKGLTAGTGTLRVDQLGIFTATFPAVGYHSGTLSSGQSAPNANFGLTQISTPPAIAPMTGVAPAPVLARSATDDIWSADLFSELTI